MQPQKKTALLTDMQSKFPVLFRGPTFAKCVFFLVTQNRFGNLLCRCMTQTALQVNVLHLKPLGESLFIQIISQYTVAALRTVVTTKHSLWQHFLSNNRQLPLNNLKPYFNPSATHLGVQAQQLNNTVLYFTGVGENMLFLLPYIHQQCYEEQIKGKLDLIMSFSKWQFANSEQSIVQSTAIKTMNNLRDTTQLKQFLE